MGYLTAQRKALFVLLEKHRDEILTAEQIIALMGENASRSAVYRNLLSLEKQGLIRKTISSGSNRSQYRYTGATECRHHLHMECSKCGKTFHLNMPATNSLINNVMQDANFEIDRSSTVLYGICRKCREN